MSWLKEVEDILAKQKAERQAQEKAEQLAKEAEEGERERDKKKVLELFERTKAVERFLELRDVIGKGSVEVVLKEERRLYPEPLVVFSVKKDREELPTFNSEETLKKASDFNEIRASTSLSWQHEGEDHHISVRFQTGGREIIVEGGFYWKKAISPSLPFLRRRIESAIIEAISHSVYRPEEVESRRGDSPDDWAYF